MAIPTQEEVMITLVFGTGALVVGLYYTIFSYIEGFKDVYGYTQSRTMYEVVAKNLIVHLILVTLAVLFFNTFEAMTGLDLYGGIKDLLVRDWFALVQSLPEDQYSDIKVAGLINGYIKMFTVWLLAFAPVLIFFGIVSKQTSKCVKMSQQGGLGKGTFGCGLDILAPAIFFLVVYFIHLNFASVLIGGADSATPDREFLQTIGTNWWKQVITLS